MPREAWFRNSAMMPGAGSAMPQTGVMQICRARSLNAALLSTSSWMVFDLVNMNGRMYDPLAGRFLSPDPVLQAPDNLQNYNRYSYVLNNPLAYTDPSGNKLRAAEMRYLDGGDGDGWGAALGRYGGGISSTFFSGSSSGGGFGGPGVMNGTGLGGVYYDWNSGTYRSTDGWNDNVGWGYAFNIAQSYASERWERSSWRQDAYAGSGSEMVYKGSIWRHSSLKRVANVVAANSEGIDQAGLGEHLIGPGLILLGSKIYPKLGGIGGGGTAGKWTSPASKGLRAADRAIQGALKTDAKFAAKGLVHRYLGTRGIGAALGRAVPYVGWAWTAWDAGWYLGENYGPSTWSDRQELPESEVLEYMREKGMLDY